MEKITVYTTSEFMGTVQKYEGTLIDHSNGIMLLVFG